MENRDKTPVGEISPKPYFWGPFDEFQTIAQGGFASDDWLRHCKTYYGAMMDAAPAVLGHRYLFRDFEAIDFGGLNGASTVMAWAARYFAWSIFRARVTARLVGVAVALLMRSFALFESKKSLFDASSAVYFLGKKTDAKRVSHKELVALYDGQFPSVDG